MTPKQRAEALQERAIAAFNRGDFAEADRLARDADKAARSSVSEDLIDLRDE